MDLRVDWTHTRDWAHRFTVADDFDMADVEAVEGLIDSLDVSEINMLNRDEVEVHEVEGMPPAALEGPYYVISGDQLNDGERAFGPESAAVARTMWSPRHDEYPVTIAVVHVDDAEGVAAALNARCRTRQESRS